MGAFFADLYIYVVHFWESAFATMSYHSNVSYAREAGFRSQYLSHAKRTLYNQSYIAIYSTCAAHIYTSYSSAHTSFSLHLLLCTRRLIHSRMSRHQADSLDSAATTNKLTHLMKQHETTWNNIKLALTLYIRTPTLPFAYTYATATLSRDLIVSIAARGPSPNRWPAHLMENAVIVVLLSNNKFKALRSLSTL